MPQNRIESHPILKISQYTTIEFYWKDQLFQARLGETIASALIANGVDIFGHHPKDGKPLGLFCANGQCSQCLVLVEGKPIKACMSKIKPGMSILPAAGLPNIADINHQKLHNPPDKFQEIYDIPILVIGGGPAGLSAAIELGQLGVKVLLVDDKSELGGKLVLQTHRFFGSTQAVYAGMRGIDIAQKLADKLTELNNVEIWLETTAVGIFEERTVGLWRVKDEKYILVKPEILLVATGARERNLTFKGNTLPGIIGAGAFQTLVNRDLIKPSRNLFIIGGGNVGLIAGYHALQAGINVVGLVEALPKCGGYKVHEDKLARLGVPIFTSHTILEAKGQDHVQGVKIAEVDANFQPKLGTEKEFSCDCVLIAVGLNPVDEFITKAREVGLTCFSAGDADEIAEASAAMFSGKIKGLEIARKLNRFYDEIPQEWRTFEDILKSKPGEIIHIESEFSRDEVFPVIHCRQEIPCDPCAYICPLNLIKLQGDDILSLPDFFATDGKHCIGCERCVAVCPGLAITLIDARKDPSFPTVSIPYEFLHEDLNIGDLIKVTDEDGNLLGRYPIMSFNNLRKYSRTTILRVQVPRNIATLVAGVQLDSGWSELEQASMIENHPTDQEAIVCRCEHISADVIRGLIQDGVTDINQIKAETKATMGACGGKTCLSLIKKIFKEEGVSQDKVTDPTQRPLFVEVPLEILAKNEQQWEQSLLMANVKRNTHDVIIIGAGSIGTPTAFFLAKAGLRVLVLDMYPSAGQASNKHAIGGIRATHSDLAKIYLGQESLKVFSTWKEQTGDDIEWHQGGYSFIAYDQPIAKTLKGLVQWQTDHHLNISWLDKEDLLDLISSINPEGLIGGTYSPEDGCASPLKSAFSFQHQAKKIGAEFHFNEQVLNFIVEQGRIKGVTTNNGLYTSAIVINAAGGWAKELSAKLGLDVPVEPDAHEAAITEPVKRFFHPMIVDMRSRPGSQNFYFYQHITGKIIFCMTPDPPILGNHTIASSDFLPRASRRLIDVMPVLKDIRVRRVWRGTYPMTPDGSPIIGKVDGLSGYLLAVGMCGQGFMLGPGIAELLTRLILNDLNKTDRIILENLSFHRNFNQEELLK